MGRIRLHFAVGCSRYSLEYFILENNDPGTTIATNSWQGYQQIDIEQFAHETTNQSKKNTRN